jgi:hypothetical protein
MVIRFANHSAESRWRRTGGPDESPPRLRLWRAAPLKLLLGGLPVPSPSVWVVSRLRPMGAGYPCFRLPALTCRANVVSLLRSLVARKRRERTGHPQAITLVGLGQPHVVSVEARCPRATDRRTYWVLSALASGFPPRMETVAFSSSVITNWSCSVQCNWIDLNLSFRAQVFAGVYNTPICNLHINDRNGHHDFPSLSTTAAYASANLPDSGGHGCRSLVPGGQCRR